MKTLYDYFYRFPREHPHLRGRCRVRIYQSQNGAHIVLLTELDTNRGESIAAACERIVTDLAAVRSLNPKKTRWIQHEPPQDELPHIFHELQFTWDSNASAQDPLWQRLSIEEVEGLTGDSLDLLERRLGDIQASTVMEEIENNET